MATIDDIEIADQLPPYASHPHIAKLLSAWNVWRGKNAIPQRSDVQLSDVKSLLSFIVLFDMVSREQIICRYIGSSYLDLFGQDYTGANFLEVTPPEARDIRSRRLSAVVEQPCVAFWSANTVFAKGEALATTGVCLPIQAPSADAPMQMMQLLVLENEVPFAPFQRESQKVMVKNSDHFSLVGIQTVFPPDGSVDVSIETQKANL